MNRNSTFEKAKKMKVLYLLSILPMIQVFIFCYVPMYGVIIAFKDFNSGLGFLASPWNNFEHFRMLFSSLSFIKVLKNTIIISCLRIIIGFPAPIIFALLLNELRIIRFKKTVQTISYLPYFMSWVVLSGIILEIFSPQRGIISYVVKLFGGHEVNLLISTVYFVPILIITGIWQSMGWDSVIYLASLSSVNPELYESATLDGANRFKKAVHISIPCLAPAITILFILQLGGILNAGFDQILNMYNPLVYDVADIIDTYVYRTGLLNSRYDYATAVGLFKNVVGVVLVLGSNFIVRKYSEYALW